MKLLSFLFFIISIQCFAQGKDTINSDTILISTHLPDKTVYQLDSLPADKPYVAWFSFVNDSGKQLELNGISTGDGGTYVIAKGKTFNGAILAANDTLIFGVYFVPRKRKGVHQRDIQIIGVDPKDKMSYPLIRFELIYF